MGRVSAKGGYVCYVAAEVAGLYTRVEILGVGGSRFKSTTLLLFVATVRTSYDSDLQHSSNGLNDLIPARVY